MRRITHFGRSLPDPGPWTALPTPTERRVHHGTGRPARERRLPQSDRWRPAFRIRTRPVLGCGGSSITPDRPVAGPGVGAPVAQRPALSASTKRRYRRMRWCRLIEKAGPRCRTARPGGPNCGSDRPPSRVRMADASAGRTGTAMARGGSRGERMVGVLFYPCFDTGHGHKSPPWLPPPAGTRREGAS